MFYTSIVIAIGSNTSKENTTKDNSKLTSTPFLFRSYISPLARTGFRDHYPIWKVARATSAAPAYLRGVDIEGRKFIDGAIGCNNPTEELHDEVENLYGDKANSLVVSIGPRSSMFKGLIGVVKGAVSMLKIHENMERRCTREGFRYYRFNVENNMGKIKIGAYKLTKNCPG